MCLAPLGWLRRWFEVFDKRHSTKCPHVSLGERIAATDMTGGQFVFAVGFAHFRILAEGGQSLMLDELSKLDFPIAVKVVVFKR